MQLNANAHLCRGIPLCNNASARGGKARNGATQHMFGQGGFKRARAGSLDREQTAVNRPRISLAFGDKASHSFPLIGDRQWPPCLSPSSTFSSYSVVFLFLVISIGSAVQVRRSRSRLYSKAHGHSSGQQIQPYFPRHHERDTYVTLLQRSDPPASDALLKAALVRRAIADVQRILRIREDKPALQNLLQKGSIGDDLWNSLLSAEKELEAEIVEVHAEANTFVEGWGQVLFQTASEMLANEKTRAIAEQMPLERARNGIHPYFFDLCLLRC
jgi:hypothetical protein